MLTEPSMRALPVSLDGDSPAKLCALLSRYFSFHLLRAPRPRAPPHAAVHQLPRPFASRDFSAPLIGPSLFPEARAARCRRRSAATSLRARPTRQRRSLITAPGQLFLRCFSDDAPPASCCCGRAASIRGVSGFSAD